MSWPHSGQTKWTLDECATGPEEPNPPMGLSSVRFSICAPQRGQSNPSSPLPVSVMETSCRESAASCCVAFRTNYDTPDLTSDDA